MRVLDPDVEELARCGQLVQGIFADEVSAWTASPFGWIKLIPSSRKRGKAAEKLVAAYLAVKDFTVGPTRDSDADLMVNGRRAEIKFSSLWETGLYKFQQLRDQRYDFAICLGISPFDAHCWVLPKEVILANWGRAPGLTSQHGGQAGTDTAWLSVRPDAPHAWLAEYGGRLGDGIALLRRLADRG